ncbi:MAG TPA: hypothetical protein VLL74_04020, partial [Methanoregula sp.]|nr:hypothetical protein [Methanoregula sp.]
MADEPEVRWYLKPFACDCRTMYWFEVTEMEKASKAGFTEERDYLYYCNTCKKSKIVSYTADDIEER